MSSRPARPWSSAPGRFTPTDRATVLIAVAAELVAEALQTRERSKALVAEAERLRAGRRAVTP